MGSNAGPAAEMMPADHHDALMPPQEESARRQEEERARIAAQMEAERRATERYKAELEKSVQREKAIAEAEGRAMERRKNEVWAWGAGAGQRGWGLRCRQPAPGPCACASGCLCTRQVSAAQLLACSDSSARSSHWSWGGSADGCLPAAGQ